MKYRPEIDGLRAIAVLSVFFYHLSMSSFSGGFVGVDVFFVISGFLITSIIYKDLQGGKFTFAKFYERRIRRIIPALYVTLIFSILFTYKFFMVPEFKKFSRSLLACLLFYSNILFRKEAGYFDQESEMKPLLHTWSLSIEEQFYIFFPTILILCFKYCRKYIPHVLALMAAISFAFSLHYVDYKPDSAFYYMHLRAWELLMGSLLALNAVPKMRSGKLLQFTGLAGLAMIFYGIFTLTENSTFPGFNAFIPCIGTAMIIYVSTHDTFKTWVGRLLSTSPMTGVGKISYSLYLWHWPAIVFVKYYLVKEIGWQQQVVIFFSAFILSVLSWKYIEQPFRTKEGIFKSNKLVFGSLGVLTLLMGIFAGIGGYKEESFRSRLLPEARAFSRATRDNNPERERCHEHGLKRLQTDDICTLGENNGKSPQFVMWGDSHADAWMPAFQEMAHKNGVFGYYMSSSACPPLLDVIRVNEKKSKECFEFNNRAIEVIRKHKIPVTILVSRWASMGVYMPNQKAADYDKMTREEKLQVFEHGLNSILGEIQKAGSKIWVMKKTPYATYNIPSALARYVTLGRPVSELKIKISEYKEQSNDFNVALDHAMKKYPITTIDPALTLCSEDRGGCDVVEDNKPLYYDHHHLSKTGAIYLSPILQPFFDDVKKVSVGR